MSLSASHAPIRLLFVSMLVCASTACDEDYKEPPRNLDGAVFVPPILDGGLDAGRDAGLTLSIDAGLGADLDASSGDAAVAR